MKNFIIILISLFLSLNLKAQLKVESDGDVVVPTRLRIGTNLSALYTSNNYHLEIGSKAHGSSLSLQSGLTDDALYVKSNGYIGINRNNPGYRLDVNGNTRINDILIWYYYSENTVRPYYNENGFLGLHSHFWERAYIKNIYYKGNISKYSDRKTKQNIKSLNNSLAKVLKMRGVKYDLNVKSFPNSDSLLITHKDSAKIGLIAQELLDILPEVVDYDTAAKLYAIDYVSLIPVLIEAIKEQNKSIEELKKYKNPKFKSSSTLLPEVNASLSPNKPNPFSEETTIEYYLSSDIQEATLYLYDLQGKQIKSISIVQREYGSETIYANELYPGMYKYALVADGTIVGTETMILTE